MSVFSRNCKPLGFVEPLGRIFYLKTPKNWRVLQKMLTTLGFTVFRKNLKSLTLRPTKVLYTLNLYRFFRVATQK